MVNITKIDVSKGPFYMRAYFISDGDVHKQQTNQKLLDLLQHLHKKSNTAIEYRDIEIEGEKKTPLNITQVNLFCSPSPIL